MNKWNENDVDTALIIMLTVNGAFSMSIKITGFSFERGHYCTGKWIESSRTELIKRKKLLKLSPDNVQTYSAPTCIPFRAQISFHFIPFQFIIIIIRCDTQHRIVWIVNRMVILRHISEQYTGHIVEMCVHVSSTQRKVFCFSLICFVPIVRIIIAPCHQMNGSVRFSVWLPMNKPSHWLSDSLLTSSSV